MDKYNFFKVAKNKGWLRILIPMLIICIGCFLLLSKLTGFPHENAVAVCICVGTVMAFALTAFVIKCYIFYVKEMEKQYKEIDDLQKEVNDLEQG